MNKILIAEDDFVSRKLLQKSLINWGFDVEVVEDGAAALDALNHENAPRLAILDWMMPGMTGIDVCRAIRMNHKGPYIYIILLTALEQTEHVVEGFDAGADDYISKPFQAQELRARIKVGLRILELQKSLSDHIYKLQDALNNIKELQGLLPICSYCKRIRDDKNYWQQVEGYISEHTNVQFSHSICPDCYEKVVEPALLAEEEKIAKIKNKKSTNEKTAAETA